MSLETNKFLHDLISLGTDAGLNLFKIEMSGLSDSVADDSDLKGITLRSKTFVAPKRDVTTTEIPWQNTNISIPVPQADISKVLSLDVRIDSGYKTYETLRKLQLIDDNGRYYRDPKKKIASMTVTAYDSSATSESLDPVYEWVFKEVYITSISQITYSYESATQLSCQVGILWGTYSERAL